MEQTKPNRFNEFKERTQAVREQLGSIQTELESLFNAIGKETYDGYPEEEWYGLDIMYENAQEALKHVASARETL